MSKNSKSTQKKTTRASKQTIKRFLASVKKNRFGLFGFSVSLRPKLLTLCALVRKLISLVSAHYF